MLKIPAFLIRRSSTVTDNEGRAYPMSNTAASVLDAIVLRRKLNIEIICKPRYEDSVQTGKYIIITEQ
jgi:hydrogenase maturation factor